MKEAGLRDVDWAYLAGFLDGEGSFFIHWHVFKDRNLIYGYPAVSVSLAESERPILEELKSLFGGRIFHHSRQASWSWEILALKSVKRLLEGVYPYSRLKRERITLLLKAIEVLENKKSNYTREEILALAEISDRCHEMSSDKRPKIRRWRYETVKEFLDRTRQGSPERIQENFQKFLEAGKPTRFAKGHIPWNKALSEEELLKHYKNGETPLMLWKSKNKNLSMEMPLMLWNETDGR